MSEPVYPIEAVFQYICGDGPRKWELDGFEEVFSAQDVVDAYEMPLRQVAGGLRRMKIEGIVVFAGLEYGHSLYRLNAGEWVWNGRR